MMYQQIAGSANGLIFYSFLNVLRTRKEEREKENLVLRLEGWRQ